MTTTLYLRGLVAVLLTGSMPLLAAAGVTPSNPNASDAARSVLEYLASLPGRPANSLVVGQHIGFTTSVYLTTTDYVPNGYGSFVTPLQQQSGKWLGLVGADFSTIDPGYTYPLDYTKVTSTLIDHWNKGGLVTVMYTSRNPWTWKTGNDRTVMTPMSDIVTPGTVANRNWLTQLDSVAAGLKVLRDAGVVVLFRPLHEINGTWFWYAYNPANPTNAQDTIALWRYTHDYLTRTKGLDNLLWVYAASVSNGVGASDELNFYPGDAWVDVVGIDRYTRTFEAATVAAFGKLRALGKPMCLCEVGPSTQASDGTFDYQAFVASEIRAKVPDIAYLMAWADYPSGGAKATNALASNRNAAGLLGDPWTVTADDNPRFPPDPAGDVDGDGIPNGVEQSGGRNRFVKDNDVFVDARLFAMQQYRDFLSREGDSGGVAHWSGQMNGGAQSRAQMVETFFNSAEFQGVIAPVARLYFAYFLRIPDYGGLNHWIGQARAGQSLAQISDAFAASVEFTARYGSLSDGQFVVLVYQNVLGRAPDAAGLAYWSGRLAGGLARGSLMAQFSESAEYQALIASEIYVTMMYQGMLRRAPDQTGFDYWVSYLDKGSTGLALISGFLAAPEYRARFLP